MRIRLELLRQRLLGAGGARVASLRLLIRLGHHGGELIVELRPRELSVLLAGAQHAPDPLAKRLAFLVVDRRLQSLEGVAG